MDALSQLPKFNFYTLQDNYGQYCAAMDPCLSITEELSLHRRGLASVRLQIPDYCIFEWYMVRKIKASRFRSRRKSRPTRIRGGATEFALRTKQDTNWIVRVLNNRLTDDPLSGTTSDSSGEYLLKLYDVRDLGSINFNALGFDVIIHILHKATTREYLMYVRVNNDLDTAVIFCSRFNRDLAMDGVERDITFSPKEIRRLINETLWPLILNIDSYLTRIEKLLDSNISEYMPSPPPTSSGTRVDFLVSKIHKYSDSLRLLNEMAMNPLNNVFIPAETEFAFADFLKFPANIDLRDRPINEHEYAEQIKEQKEQKRDREDPVDDSRELKRLVRSHSEMNVIPDTHSIIDILRLNNIYPLDTGVMRSIVQNDVRPSHIVIGISSHGTIVPFSNNYDVAKYKQNVSIFSEAPYGNSTFVNEYDDISKNEIVDVLHQNYPILNTFRALRAQLTCSQCKKTEGLIQCCSNKYNIRDAFNNNEHATFHLFSHNMEYTSDSYDNLNFTQHVNIPLIISVYDIRYPKTEKHRKLLDTSRSNPEHICNLLLDNEILNVRSKLNNTTYKPTYHKEMYLDKFIKFLKDDLEFEHIIIHEIACRPDNISRPSEETKRVVYHSLRDEFHDELAANSVRETYGGRRAIYRPTRFRRRTRRRSRHRK